MKKFLILLMVLITVVLSGCGDKFAKEKEAITKAEQAAMDMKLPDLVAPYTIKKPSKEDWDKYRKAFKELLESETKILAEMKKSDAKIAEMEKTASESEKKDLKAFKDKIHQARIEFVRKISKGRLRGDTFIVGVGSTWQEIEMVYGTPQSKKSDYDYNYGEITFSDWYSKGVPPKGYKFVSDGPQAVFVTGGSIISDAGVKIGMTRDEVKKVLTEKSAKGKVEERKLIDGSKDELMQIPGYSMKTTQPYNLFCRYSNGKLQSYNVSRN